MSSTTFTEREQQIMATAWTCFEDDPKVDYNKLATKLGMSNPRSASNAWNAIKKKLAAQRTSTADDGEDAPQSGTSSPKPKTPGSGKKRGKAGGKADAPAGDDDGASPNKKAKKGGGRGKKAAGEDAEAGAEVKDEAADDE